jgi:hypothetical protein
VETAPTDLRRARHDLRGRINALMLCVSAFDVVQTQGEALEFLEMIERGCDKLIVALDTFEALSAATSAKTE